MKIAVSACLLGENCKYSGGNNYSEKVKEFVKGHEVIPVCPEVMGGLPVPRDPVEMVDGVLIDCKGVNRENEFRGGAKKAFDLAVSKGAELVILQSRSPSCGVKEVYDGTFSGVLIPGQGVFAEMLIKAGIKVIDVDDL